MCGVIFLENCVPPLLDGGSGWEPIQRPSVPACGGGGKRWVELAFLASFESEPGDTLQPSPQPLPGLGQMGGPGALLVWGRDTVGGHCRTDALVCGPTSPPEKASGENTLVLLVQAL